MHRSELEFETSIFHEGVNTSDYNENVITSKLVGSQNTRSSLIRTETIRAPEPIYLRTPDITKIDYGPRTFHHWNSHPFPFSSTSRQPPSVYLWHFKIRLHQVQDSSHDQDASFARRTKAGTFRSVSLVLGFDLYRAAVSLSGFPSFSPFIVFLICS